MSDPVEKERVRRLVEANSRGDNERYSARELLLTQRFIQLMQLSHGGAVGGDVILRMLQAMGPELDDSDNEEEEVGDNNRSHSSDSKDDSDSSDDDEDDDESDSGEMEEVLKEYMEEHVNEEIEAMMQADADL